MSNANFQTGFNRIYDRNLALSLRRIYARHHHLFEAEAAAPGGKREPGGAGAARRCRRLGRGRGNSEELDFDGDSTNIEPEPGRVA